MKVKILLAIGLLAPAIAIAAPVELECIRETDEGKKYWGVMMDTETGEVLYARQRGEFKNCKQDEITDQQVFCKVGLTIDGYSDSVSIDRYSGVLTLESKLLWDTYTWHYDCGVAERATKKF